MERSSADALRQAPIEPIYDSDRDAKGVSPCSLPRRHDFVWLSTNALITAAKAGDQKRAAQWVGRGLPAVVARRSAALAVDELNLGIALPASHCRVRIGFAASLQSVQKIASTPHLAEAVASAPDEWRRPLLDLCANALAIGIGFRVYGSLAWQHLIGKRYVTQSSDVDLLWQPRSREQLAKGIMLLSSCAQQSGLRLDGEIVWPDGAAVAWREMAAGQDRVLVKRLTSVSLQNRDALLRKFAA